MTTNLYSRNRFHLLLPCLALLLVPLVLRAQTNAESQWSGGGGLNQNWSTAANWNTVGTSLAAPPHNPMTPHQAALGNGWGDVAFYGTPTPATSTAHVDVPWKIAVLFIGNNKNVNLYGQDITIQQAALGGNSANLASAAIQVQRNNSGLLKTVNITNNIIFDDSFYAIDTNYVAHSILQNNGNTTFNFYGHVSNPGSNSWFITRSSSPIHFHGGLSASLTPNSADPNVGLWNVNIAGIHPTASVAPIVNFPKANNSWKYMDVDRGTVIIGTNDALPTASWFWFGDSPGRPVIFTMGDWNQTFERVFDTGAAATQARTINTGAGAGGTLTINDVGTSNNWSSIVMTGTGRLVKNGSGYLAFEKTQTYTGGTTINGGTLRLGTGGAGGLLDGNANIVNNGTLIINSTDAFTLNGSLTGTGGLQKLASGATSLNGVTSYAGDTTVAGGSLTIGASGNVSASPAITLANGAMLDISATPGLTRSAGQSLSGNGSVVGTVAALPGSTVTVGSSPGTLTVGTLTLDTATVNMELSADPNIVGGGVNDLISVGGTLTLTNVSAVNLTPLAKLSITTPYTLMQSAALIGFPSNLNVTLPYAGRYSFAVLDTLNTSNNVMVSVASSLNGDLMWRGGNPGNPTRWDITTTTNWLNGGLPDAFLNHDPVAFDDTALTNRVTLAADVICLAFSALNNSLNYLIDGPNSLTMNTLEMQGSGGFTIANNTANSLGAISANAGTLTLANAGANAYTTLAVNGGNVVFSNGVPNSFAPINLTNGSVTIANNAANTYSSLVVAGGTLAFNQPTNVTVSTAIVGAGTVAKNGSSQLTLSADNINYTGGMQLNNGVLRVTANNALGDGTLTIASGATLDFNHPTANTLNVSAADVIVQGPGVGGLGAITSSGNHQAFAVKMITLTGDTTFNGLWENAGGGTFVGNSFKITKVGVNDLWIESASSDPNFGDIDVQQGLFGIETPGTTLGNPANTITVRSNAVFAFYDVNTAGNKQFVLENGGGLIGGGGASPGNAFGGMMQVSGLTHVNLLTSNSGLTNLGTMFGSGTMMLGSTGMYTLAGENINTGGFIVTNGALRLAHPLALSTNLTVEIRTNGAISGAVIVGASVPRVELDGVTIPAGTTVKMFSDDLGSCRTTLGVATATTGEFQGTVIPNGNGICALAANLATSTFTLSGPYTNLNFTGYLNLRGNGLGFISGRVHIGGVFRADPGGTGIWTISSTGNQWTWGDLYGPVRIGTNDALCVTAPLLLGLDGTLDLAGFNQTVPSIEIDFTSPPTTGFIGNSSTASDSLLTIKGNGSTNVTTITNGLSIVNALVGGTMKTALTITNRSVRIFSANTYTGPTLVQNGATLGGPGSLTSPVTVESGGTLAPGASIGVMTIANSLTLNPGSTTIMEVTHTPAANDGVAGMTSVTYGGTLMITNIGVAALAPGDSFLMFQAGAYSGSFSSIVPASPGPGLAWDTANLNVNGRIAVVATTPPHVDTVTKLPDGNVQLALSGPTGAGYTVRASTNVGLPLASWTVIGSGTITTSPFNFTDLNATNFTQRFYRMSIP